MISFFILFKLGESCLHAGCKYGHTSVVEYLVSIHTKIDLQDSVSFYFLLFFFYKNPVILFCHHHHDEHDHWSAMIMMMIMINLYHKHDQWSLIMMIMTNIQHKESGLHIAAGTDSLGLSSFSVKPELNKNEVRHHNYHHTHHHYHHHHHHHHHDLVSRTRRLHPTWRKKIKKIYVLFWKIVSKIIFQPYFFRKNIVE